MKLERPIVTGFSVTLLVCVAALACSGAEAIDVPDDKRQFIGRWSNERSLFDLKSDGQVDLELQWEHRSLAVWNGALRRFDGGQICAAAGWAGPLRCFEISEEPYEVDGVRAIRLGGLELREEATGSPARVDSAR